MSLVEWVGQLEAEVAAREAELSGSSGQSEERLAGLLSLGSGLAALARLKPAHVVLLEALDLAVSLGNETSERLAAVELGVVLASGPDESMGRLHLERASEGARRSDPDLSARAAAELSMAWARLGDPIRARTALSVAGASPYRLLATAALAEHKGDLDASARLLGESIDLSDALPGGERLRFRVRAGQRLDHLEQRQRTDPAQLSALGPEVLAQALAALIEIGVAPSSERPRLAADRLQQLLGLELVELSTPEGVFCSGPNSGEVLGPALRVGKVSLRTRPELNSGRRQLATAVLSAAPYLSAPSASEEVQVLQLLDRLMASDLDGERLFSLATDLALEATGAKRGRLLLLGGQHLEAAPPWVSTSLVRRVTLTGRSLLLEDAAAAPPTGAGESIGTQGLRSIVAVPLLGRRGQILGVLYVDDPGSAGAFGSHELSVLTGFAARLGPQVENVLREQLRREASQQPTERGSLAGLETKSPKMQEALNLLRRAAEVDAPLLICGEGGVGKEHLARLMHEASPRSEAPFVVLACASVVDDLLESELFGHRAGAFTDAYADREGVFQAARGGTLLLDGLEDASPRLQAELLRAVETGEIRPLGGTPEQADARIVAAFRGDPAQAVQAGTLRQDLFYRLNLLRIVVPSLRERREDLPSLVTDLLVSLGAGERELSAGALETLLKHPWEGNLRELEACLERALIGAPEKILARHLYLEAPRRQPSPSRLNPRQLQLLDELAPGDWIKAGDYAERRGVSTATAWRDLANLVAQGFMVAQGKGRGAAYYVA